LLKSGFFYNYKIALNSFYYKYNLIFIFYSLDTSGVPSFPSPVTARLPHKLPSSSLLNSFGSAKDRRLADSELMTGSIDSARRGSIDSARTGSTDSARRGSIESARTCSTDSGTESGGAASTESGGTGSIESAMTGSTERDRTGSGDSDRTGKTESVRTGSTGSDRTGSTESGWADSTAMAGSIGRTDSAASGWIGSTDGVQAGSKDTLRRGWRMDALRQYRKTEGVASAPGAIPACRVKTTASKKDSTDREAQGTNDTGFKFNSSNGATKGVNNADNDISAKRSTVTSSWLSNDQSRLEMTGAVAAGNQSAVERTKEADAIDQSAIELTKEADTTDKSSVAMTGEAATRKYIRKRESYMICF
jgi:hypothetical protein